MESERVRKQYDNISREFPTSEPNVHNLKYVPLPNIHPDPLKSIQLTQKIYDLIKAETNLPQGIQKIYSALDDQEKYFFCLYAKEYFQDNYYGSFYRSFLKENSGLSSGIIKFSSLNNFFEAQKEQALYLDLYKNRLQEGIEVLEFILLRLPHLQSMMQREYGKKYHADLEFLADNPEIIASHTISTRKFRVNITNKSEDYIFRVRELFKRSESRTSQLVDAFIYNSFLFPSNTSSVEFLSFPFEDKGEVYRFIHLIYLEHKRIVKRPKVTKLDFARLMYLNFDFVRQGWEKALRKNPKDSIDSFLKRSTAKNITNS